MYWYNECTRPFLVVSSMSFVAMDTGSAIPKWQKKPVHSQDGNAWYINFSWINFGEKGPVLPIKNFEPKISIGIFFAEMGFCQNWLLLRGSSQSMMSMYGLSDLEKWLTLVGRWEEAQSDIYVHLKRIRTIRRWLQASCQHQTIVGCSLCLQTRTIVALTLTGLLGLIQLQRLLKHLGRGHCK